MLLSRWKWVLCVSHLDYTEAPVFFSKFQERWFTAGEQLLFRISCAISQQTWWNAFVFTSMNNYTFSFVNCWFHDAYKILEW